MSVTMSGGGSRGGTDRGRTEEEEETPCEGSSIPNVNVAGGNVLELDDFGHTGDRGLPERPNEVDGSCFETTGPPSSTLDGTNNTHSNLKPAASPSSSSSSPSPLVDVSSGGGVDDEDEVAQSARPRRVVSDRVCCCYQTVHRAFLRCVEETPAMVSGLLLSMALCVAVIVLIPTTGRVRRCDNELTVKPRRAHVTQIDGVPQDPPLL